MIQSKIKVLIADDSVFMRKILSDLINSDQELEVVAIAKNGEEAYQKATTLQPDVVILDIEMPVMNGLETLEKIMCTSPMPVIMFSALTQAGTLATIEALEKGAIDCLAKPDGKIIHNLDEVRSELIYKIKSASKVMLRKSIGIQTIKQKKSSYYKRKTKPIYFDNSCRALVAIGTSTGGPRALCELMRNLPTGLNASFLIVQHMPPGFTKSFARRLDSLSPLTVKEAEHGEEIKVDCAYLAPGDYHLEAGFLNNKLSVILRQSPSVNGHRPSVDVLMNSVAKINYPKIGVIMTGMGSDGAKGMLELKKAGSLNIGENAETCVIYGMSKASRELGAIDYEVPLYKIAEYIVQALKKC